MDVFTTDLEKAVLQVLGVEAIMKRDLHLLDPGQWTLLTYKEFCGQPESIRDWIEAAYADAGFELVRRKGYREVTYRAYIRWACAH